MTTLAACLTPPGSAALATLAVRGPRAWQIVRGLFRSHLEKQTLPEVAEAGRFWLGKLGDELADEVLVAVRTTKPVPSVEVHCHGGREVVRMLLETLRGRGAQVVAWQRLVQAVEIDPLRAAATAALAETRTLRTASILLDQHNGALRRAIEAIQIAYDGGNMADASRLLKELARHTRLGRHLTAAWRVVVAGAPNVGKSSLVNALAGFPRCVVSPTPGTTRDVVTTLIAVEGWPVELADTAGLRDATGPLEELGIGQAKAAAAQADLCLWVLDAAAPPVWPHDPADNLRLLVNKMDLPAAWDLREATDAVRVSAQTGAGLDELCQALASWLVPEPPAPGGAVPFTAALCEAVEDALRRNDASALWSGERPADAGRSDVLPAG